MNRRQFFKRAAIVAAGAAAAPLVSKSPEAQRSDGTTITVASTSGTTPHIAISDSPTFTFVASTDTSYVRELAPHLKRELDRRA